MNRFLYLCLLTLGLTCTFAQRVQRYNSISYNVNEGLLQSNVLELAFDRNNFCWLAFANGIQQFDGKTFTTIPVQPGLTDDKWVHFYRCNNGDLLISHAGGISKYDDRRQKFTLLYDVAATGKEPPEFIGEDDNVLFFFTESSHITGMDTRSYKIVSDTKTAWPPFSINSMSKPIFSNILQHRVVLKIGYNMFLWDLRQKKLLASSPAIEQLYNYMLKLTSDSTVLYGNLKKNIALIEQYNFNSGKQSPVFEKAHDGVKAFRNCLFSWRDKQLLSFQNFLFETDEHFNIQASVVNFQNQPVAGNAVIARMSEDNFGNLYVITINDGIRKILRNNFPIRYYGTDKKEDNYVISILEDKVNNRILAGTYGNGLLVFDTLQHLIKHLPNLPGEPYKFSPNAITKIRNGNYLMLVGGSKKIWRLDAGLSTITDINVQQKFSDNQYGAGYFANVLVNDEQRIIMQSQSNAYDIDVTGTTATEHTIASGNTMSGLFFNNLVITHTNDELIFIDANTFTEQKRLPFKNTGSVRCFTKDAAGFIYIGSNKGVFKIDSSGKVLQHFNKNNGLPDECIYAMALDKQNNLWCSSNKGIFKIGKDGSIAHLKKEDGLQENEFNTNTVATAADGELFFGGINGISSFYPSGIISNPETVDIYFTSIKSNNQETFADTAVHLIDNIDLPYNNSSLSFDFIAMGPHNPDAYVYQYKMEGVDNNWIQASNPETIHYFLLPGKYVFKVYASAVFDKNAQPLKEITIVIHPPFWKLWWVRVGVAVMSIGLLIWLINIYNKNKFQKKLAELESAQKLQLERERISRDLHDNIGAYANAVIYKTELLQAESDAIERTELMNDLKFASKDIITSLRETIWALKKDSYTAQDCLLRIRNFIQPLNRYYDPIRITIEGDAPADVNLHYSHALNLVRIVQEAVSNAIKHTEARLITINSSVNDNRWTLTVTDNGKGFQHTADNDAQGNGLGNMKQRSADSGFDFSIMSTPGKGTVITIVV